MRLPAGGAPGAHCAGLPWPLAGHLSDGAPRRRRRTGGVQKAVTSPTGRRIIFICRAEKSADFPALLFSRRIRQKEPLQPKSAAAPVICDDSVLPLVVFAVGVFGGSHAAVLEHTFHHSAVLIGKADDDGLAAAGHMTEGQRPHVAGNDALFLFGDMEHLFCVDAGAARVGEAVHLEHQFFYFQ